jgi:hypothetical protein
VLLGIARCGTRGEFRGVINDVLTVRFKRAFWGKRPFGERDSIGGQVGALGLTEPIDDSAWGQVRVGNDGAGHCIRLAG